MKYVPVQRSSPVEKSKTTLCTSTVSYHPSNHKTQLKNDARTQSNAFDSLAHTNGHSNGVIVAPVTPAISSSIEADERLRFSTGSEVEVQLSQEEVRDLKDPDLMEVMRSAA